MSENLKELYKKNEVIIITSLLQTKDFKAVFSELQNISDKIFITSLKNVAYGLTSQEIKDKMKELNISVENIIFEDDINKAYKESLKLLNNTIYNFKAIIVCGSFYEISEFEKIVL